MLSISPLRIGVDNLTTPTDFRRQHAAERDDVYQAETYMQCFQASTGGMQLTARERITVESIRKMCERILRVDDRRRKEFFKRDTA